MTRSRSGGRNSGRYLFLGAVGGNLLLIAVAIFFLGQNYLDIERSVQRNSDNLVELIGRDIESDFRIVDLALLGIADEYASPHAPNQREMERWMRTVRSHHTILNSLRITDVAGEVIHDREDPGRPRVNVGDREYFQRLRNDPQPGLLVSAPMSRRPTGETVIILARRLNGADGRFAGAVIVAIPVEHFYQKFLHLKLGAHDAIVFRDLDSRLVSRYPALSGSQGGAGSSEGFAAAIARSPEHGRYTADDESGDGIARMHSYRRNPSFGFYVDAGIGRADAFADWRYQARILVAIVLFFVLGTLLLAWRLRCAWRAQAEANERLAAQQTQLTEAQRIAQLGHFSFDLRAGTWHASPALAAIYGIDDSYPRDQAGWQQLIHPDDRDAVLALVRKRAIEQGLPVDASFRICQPGGAVRWVQARATVSRQGAANTPVMFGTVQDITERKQLELELGNAKDLLEAASQTARVGGWSLELPSMKLSWTDETYRLHDLEAGSPISVEQVVSLYVPASREVIASVLQQAIDDGTPWDRELELTTPRGRAVWGRSFGRAERRDGKTVRLYGAFIDITEQRSASRDLAISEARFQSFFDFAMIGMAVATPDKGWQLVNPALCDILGYPEDVLLTKTWAELTPPDDLATELVQFDRVMAGEIDGYSMEKRFLHPDGRVVDAFVSARAVRRADGTVDFFSASVQDISPRKHAERALRQTNDLIEAAGSAAKVGGWSLELPSRALTWTAETYRIHDLAPGLPMTVEQSLGFYTPESQALVEAAIDAGGQRGRPWDLELQLVTATGRRIWTRAIGRAEWANGKVVRLFGAFLDIDAQKLAADALAESERRFRLLAEYSAAYIFEISPAGLVTFSNRFSGQEAQPLMIGTPIVDCFPAATRLAIATAFEQAMSCREEQRVDYEAIDESGKNRFYEARLIPVGDDDRDGRAGVGSVILTANDISERMQFERQLLNSRELLRQFLDHFPGTAYVKDESLRIQLANAAFKEQLGLDPAAMIGRSNQELFPGAFGDKISADDRRILAEEKTETIEESWGDGVFESIKFVIRQDGRRLLGGITLDVTNRARSRLRSEALLALNAQSGQLPERDYLKAGLQYAETLTGSQIGFLHFVNDDQQSLEFAAWTDGTLKACQATYDNHYPIGRAGVWADCFRSGAPVVFNDYAAYAEKKGLPPGHARLDRLISVPISEEGKVRMIMGVGNKVSRYDEFDVQTVQLIGNDLWRVICRQRIEQTLKDRLGELTTLNQQLEQAQNQLLQSEKMATIGQLAAGVAHELNNPIGFIQSNLGTLTGYVEDLLEVLDQSEQCAALCPDVARYEVLKQLKAAKDIAFLADDVRALLAESKDGAARVRKIVQNLKDFSHVSEEEWLWADLHQGLDSTLNLVWNEVKYKAEVEKHYAQLPAVFCMAGQINQVFMNLLVNAAQAIESKGKITLSSGLGEAETPADATVWIEVSDTGKGIPAENLKRIFDPFFTTKPVGKGTGLGLSLAWSIIQKHHGNIDVRSVVGEGTSFRITLPVHGISEPNGATK